MTRVAEIVIALAAGGASCSAPAAPAVPASVAVEVAAPAPLPVGTVIVPRFGPVSVDDGGLVLIESGRGSGAPMRQLAVSRDFRLVTTTWPAQPGPWAHPTVAEHAPLPAKGREAIYAWVNAMWPLAPSGRHTYSKAPGTAYAWVVVVRRGGEVRVLDGGALGGPDPTPGEIASFLELFAANF